MTEHGDFGCDRRDRCPSYCSCECHELRALADELNAAVTATKRLQVVWEV
jgi:hypothetical protein